MSNKRSRWDAEEDEDEDEELKRKKIERSEKKKLIASQNVEGQTTAHLTANDTSPVNDDAAVNREFEPRSRALTPSKTHRMSPLPSQPRLFLLEPPEITGCRSVDIYEKLNHIEEGSYGIVYRARDTETNEIVALKKLKLDREKNGFPTTSLREISTLMAARHPNIVNIREVVMGDSLSQYSPATVRS